MTLPDKFRLLSPFSVDCTINDQVFRFYPNSVRIASRLADMISELSGHFSVIFTNTQRDQGSTHEEVEDKDGMTVTKTQVTSINPDLARLRVDKRQNAVSGAVSALLSPKYRLVIGELLMDSLRDDYPRGNTSTTADAQDLIENMDMPTLIEFIKGLAQANAKVFGDLGNSIKAAIGGQAAGLFASLAGEVDAANVEPAPETVG